MSHNSSSVCGGFLRIKTLVLKQFFVPEEIRTRIAHIGQGEIGTIIRADGNPRPIDTGGIRSPGRGDQHRTRAGTPRQTGEAALILDGLAGQVGPSSAVFAREGHAMI